jgi:hypothetical protein
LDKSSIIVGKPKECLYLLEVLGFWPCFDRADFFLIHPDSLGSDSEAQKVDFLLMEFALLSVKLEIGGVQ